MKPSEADPIDQKSLEVLRDIFVASKTMGEALDSVVYRANHDERLEVLDKLERKGYLRKDFSQRYWVSLCGLSLLGDTTKEVLCRCERLFLVLRSHYIGNPRAKITVGELACLAELTNGQTSECLGYMIEAMCWGGHSSDLNVPEAFIQASEYILRYKNFGEVLDEADQLRAKRETSGQGMSFIFGDSSIDTGLTETPADAVASAALARYDAEHVRDAWHKALERRSVDPEGAITAARALLESVCKFILDKQNVVYEHSADLPTLYQLTSKELRLAPSQATEKLFKQILGGCHAVIAGVGALRNRLGDAHGKGKDGIIPAPRHAELAVNLAGAMATFLMATWEARKEP